MKKNLSRCGYQNNPQGCGNRAENLAGSRFSDVDFSYRDVSFVKQLNLYPDLSTNSQL